MKGYIVNDIRTGEFITTEANCEAAASALQLLDTDALPGNWAENPRGCYIKTSTSKLYFNFGGDQNDDDVDRVSICSVLSKFFHISE